MKIIADKTNVSTCCTHVPNNTSLWDRIGFLICRYDKVQCHHEGWPLTDYTNWINVLGTINCIAQSCSEINELTIILYNAGFPVVHTEETNITDNQEDPNDHI